MVALVLLFPFFGPDGSSAIAFVPVFAGSTTVHSIGSHVIAITLQADATLDQFSFQTGSPDFVFYLIGEGGAFAKFLTNGTLVPPDAAGLQHAMTPGLYHLYVWSSPGTMVQFTLTLSGLTGEAVFVADQPAAIHFERPSAVPLLLGTHVAERFQMEQSTARTTIAGVVRFEELSGPLATEVRTYRWSNESGTLFCFTDQRTVSGPTLGWLVSESEWFVFPDMPSGHLEIEFYREAVQFEQQVEVRLLTIERALGDDTPTQWSPAKPVPPLPDHIDHDPTCLRDIAGRVVGQTVVLASTETIPR